MRNVLQPFGAKATVSFEERFNRSIIRLTVRYAIIIAIVLCISGSITYTAFSSRVGRRFNSFSIGPQISIIEFQERHIPSADDVRNDLIASLILVNGSLLAAALILGYALAKSTLQPIKDSYDRQQHFLADASHELRTPLAILQLDLEHELSVAKGESRERILSNLEEVSRMSKLVNELLLLSRIDEGIATHATTTQSINLFSFIKNILTRLESVAASKDVTLHIDSTDHSLTTIGDEELLSHAFTNLIQNAISYNKPSGTVEVSIAKKGDGTEIRIADTGVGMSSKELEKIFDRFFRTDKSRSRASGGTGLGLSIAQSAIEHSGGTIDIQSTPEVGTTIIVQFPHS